MLVEAITEGEASSILAAAVDRPGSSLVGTDVGQLLGAEALGVRVTDDLSSIIGEIDVLIDFTLPEATLAHAQICAEHDVPMVIGTTGFTDDQSASLRFDHCRARSLPIVQLCAGCEPDFSTGRGGCQSTG